MIKILYEVKWIINDENQIDNFKTLKEAIASVVEDAYNFKGDYGMEFDNDNDYVGITKITLKEAIKDEDYTLHINRAEQVEKEEIIYDK